MSTYRERERRKTARRVWKPEEETVTKASEYITEASKFIKGSKVLIVQRVSTAKQENNGDLIDQEAGTRCLAEKQGLNVVGSFSYVGSGSDPTWLEKVKELADKVGATAAIAESTDRFIRHPEAFKGWKNQNLTPTREDYQRMSDCAGGLILATVVPPDATLEEVRSYQRKRGQKAKDNKGGRPRKKEIIHRKERKEDWIDRTIDLKREGKSDREVAKIVSTESGISISHMTVLRWFNNSSP